MESVFEKIGLDLKLVIASSVNFLIFLFILNKFVFNKVGVSLRKRQKMLQESLENAEQLKKQLEQAKAQSEEIIAGANREANEIVQKFTKEGEETYNTLKSKALTEAETIKKQELEKVEAERNKILGELKTQTADLAISATKKILEAEIDEKKDVQIIKKYLNEIN